jgi:Domain of unknown function (DUF4383)
VQPGRATQFKEMSSMNTTIQKLAAVFGVVFILVAIVGFIAPGGMAMQPTDPATAAKALGVFPVNLLHNIVHLLFGLWGLAVSRSWAGSKSYFTTAGIIYALLTVIAFVSPTGFGLVPLGGSDIGLHAVLAIVMLAIGFTAKDTTTRTATV